MPYFNDTFDFRSLLIVAPDMPTVNRNAARGVEEVSLDKMKRIFSDAGLTDLGVEMVPNNVLPRLQDPSYNACIIDFSVIKNDMVSLIGNIKNNNMTNQLPILVIAPGLEMDAARELYRIGVNYVMREEFNLENVNEAIWVLDSVIRFVERFKLKAPRLFR